VKADRQSNDGLGERVASESGLMLDARARNWRRLVEMMKTQAANESLQERDRRVRMLIARGRGASFRWVSLVAMMDGIMHIRQANGNKRET
jgi:predicted mannosyl-3-phosphoglycerate phosphatase (HAD superfamily)